MSGIHITEVLEILYFRAFTMPWTQTREYPQAFAVPDHNMGSRYNYMTVLCFEESVRDAVSSVDGPIKLIGEEIRLDLEYAKSLIKQHAQTSSQVMVKNLNPSPVCSCRGRSNSDNLRPNSSSTQLVPNLSRSGITGFLSGKTKPKMEGLVPTQRPVKTGDPPPSAAPALITTDTEV
ncbi:hypothetical protein BY996DRAFT_6413926 [Phakopsora pachyrhizi]|nr:hypothetical protein BY996DRAFT_6413926 [Phakopsora pachyrhizi]